MFLNALKADIVTHADDNGASCADGGRVSRRASGQGSHTRTHADKRPDMRVLADMLQTLCFISKTGNLTKVVYLIFN